MARNFLTVCCGLLFWFTATLAVDVRGRIAWNDVCGNITALGRAKATLDDGRYAASITRSGEFAIADVLDGVYLLSIVSHDFVFDQLRIDVANSTSEVRPYISGTPLNPPSTILLPYPIILSARHKFSYFNPPEVFSLVGMLSNPMMLMMVFGGAMMLAMPYLMKNLDPETLEEFKEQHARISGMKDAVASGDIKGGLSSIRAAVEETKDTREAPSTPAVNKAASKASRTGKKGKK